MLEMFCSLFCECGMFPAYVSLECCISCTDHAALLSFDIVNNWIDLSLDILNGSDNLLSVFLTDICTVVCVQQFQCCTCVNGTELSQVGILLLLQQLQTFCGYTSEFMLVGSSS